MKKVLGIFRATCYSPGMAERDEAILRAVAERLVAMGCKVDLIHEEEFTPDTPMPDIVLHMARSPYVLDLLQAWQKAGCQVINSVESIRNVERASLARLCETRGVPTPKTWIVSTTDPKPAKITYPCWMKRTGTCAQTSDDVCHIKNEEEYVQCIAHFHERNIHEVVVMEHLEGPCIKFYAVKGTHFFHCLSAYNKWEGATLPTSITEDTSNYAQAITRSLIPYIEAAEIPVIYGGDVIIADNIAYLIDLNDWPSFSSCKTEAAEAIARITLTLND